MPSTPLPHVPSGTPPVGVSPPRLHHLAGTPVRAAICDAALFDPSFGPRRAPVYGQLDGRLWQLPGVYCLLWDPEGSFPTDIYVGSCRDFYDRLIGHPQKGWTHAILLTGYGMGAAGAEQTESAFGRVITAAAPSGRLAPRWKIMPTPWGADMPWFLFESMVVLLNRCLEQIGVSVNLDPRVARL